jgi:hypothetical protein
MAVDKITKECLGNPQDTSVVTSTIEKNEWPSNLTLSKALGSTPLKIKFDARAHRMLPMALGNLVNGSWEVAGMYDPTTKQFTERSEIIRWPKTGKSTPRSWLSCKPGERLLSSAGELQHCAPCRKGTFSVGGSSSVCMECTPGERAIRFVRRIAPQWRRSGKRKSRTCMQGTSSPNKGSSVASTATASAMCTKSILGKRHAKFARRTRGDISTCLMVRTEARANARKVRRPQRLILRRRFGWYWCAAGYFTQTNHAGEVRPAFDCAR